jgi:hypothetical protein
VRRAKLGSVGCSVTLRRLLVLAGVALGACDNLLGLDSVAPADGRRDSRMLDVADAVRDIGAGDSASACSLAGLASTPSMTFPTIDNPTEIAISPGVTFVMQGDGSEIYRRASITGGTTIGPSVAGTGWSHPALSADGSTLYLTGPVTGMGAIYASGTGNLGVSWSTPLQIGAPTGAYPGAPSSPHSTSTEHMVVQTSSGDFEEWELSNDTWASVATYGQDTLAAGSGTGISYPSLSSDGLVLVFEITESGVWALLRPDLGTGFTDPSVSRVQLVSTPEPLASPYLTPDCTTVYALDQASMEIEEFTAHQ